MKAFIVIFALLILVALRSDAASGADKTRQGNNPKESVEELKRYFPLTIGNSWTYKRTVIKNKAPIGFYPYIVLKDFGGKNRKGDELSQIGEERLIKSGTETYVVRKKNRFGFEIKATGKPSAGCGISPFLVRPLQTLEWSVKAQADGSVKLFERREGRVANVELRTGFDVAMLTPGIGSTQIVGAAAGRSMGANRARKSIAVAAGKFKSTIESTVSFKFNSQPITIHRYFAKNVGLVKEEQYSGEQLLYTVELVDYKVK